MPAGDNKCPKCGQWSSSDHVCDSNQESDITLGGLDDSSPPLTGHQQELADLLDDYPVTESARDRAVRAMGEDGHDGLESMIDDVRYAQDMRQKGDESGEERYHDAAARAVWNVLDESRKIGERQNRTVGRRAATDMAAIADEAGLPDVNSFRIDLLGDEPEVIGVTVGEDDVLITDRDTNGVLSNINWNRSQDFKDWTDRVSGDGYRSVDLRVEG